MFKKSLLAVMILGMIVCVSAVLARTARITGAEVTLIEVGDRAPDFELFGVDLKYHSIGMYREVPGREAVGCLATMPTVIIATLHDSGMVAD